MSVKAMNWAMEQATGCPRTQCLLYVVADAANPEGICWPSAEWMAEKSQQSRATVYRRLGELRDMGLLALMPRWIDNDGKVHYEGGHGRRQTSPEIHLIFGATASRSRRGSRANDEDSQEDGDEGVSQAETGGLSHSAETPPSHLERQGASQSGDSKKNHNLNPLTSPQSPPSDFDEEGLGRFKASYPIPSNNPEALAATWGSLTVEQRLRARRGAEGVRVIRAKEPRRPVVDPAKFLRTEALWVEFERFAPPPVPPPPPERFVAFGSPEFRARAVRNVICGLKPQTPRQIEGHDAAGVLVKGDTPPDVMALAELAGADGRVDCSGWIVIAKTENDSDKPTPQFAAWGAWIRDITGRWPDGDRIWLDAAGEPVASADKAEQREIAGRKLPRSMQGLRVPHQWPPRKTADAVNEGASDESTGE